jgi:hypothetical protein
MMKIHTHFLAKRLGQFTAFGILATSIVTLTAQATFAVPLKPILDQKGRHIVEEMFGVRDQSKLDRSEDSNRESPTETPQKPDSSSQVSEETDSAPQPSTDSPAPSRDSNYPTRGYSPYGMPSGVIPGLPSYPVLIYPSTYPGMPSTPSSSPVIINNFK